MDKFNIVQILSVGVIGLGFLLAIMAYNLLSKEQKKDIPREPLLKAISKFMAFSLAMALIGVGSELIRFYFEPLNGNKINIREETLGTVAVWSLLLEFRWL